MTIHPPRRLDLDDEAPQLDAIDRISHAQQLGSGRRIFLRSALSLGGLWMPAGCVLNSSASVNVALGKVSQLNDKAWLFDPNRLATNHQDSMITQSFPFNAYYAVSEVRKVEASSYQLEVTGIVVDKKKWTLPELHVMQQTDQVTRYTCVEGWSAIGK